MIQFRLLCNGSSLEALVRLRIGGYPRGVDALYSSRDDQLFVRFMEEYLEEKWICKTENLLRILYLAALGHFILYLISLGADRVCI